MFQGTCNMLLTSHLIYFKNMSDARGEGSGANLISTLAEQTYGISITSHKSQEVRLWFNSLIILNI